MLNISSSLVRLPLSIGELQNLKELDLANCVSLKFLPKSCCGLKSLSSLNLKSCKSLIVEIERQF